MNKYQLSDRGFYGMDFQDINRISCSIQESSADGNKIWLGVNGNRMHLDQESVKTLLPYLQRFAETGELFED